MSFNIDYTTGCLHVYGEIVYNVKLLREYQVLTCIWIAINYTFISEKVTYAW